MPASHAERPNWDPQDGIDLRRARRDDIAERIVFRAKWLPEPDRHLLLALYREGQSVARVAALAGQPPESLRRHARRLVRRVLSPAFAFVALHHRTWPPRRRAVAAACFLEGRSMREAARVSGLSLHTVRRHRADIDAIVSAHPPPRHATPRHAAPLRAATR